MVRIDNVRDFFVRIYSIWYAELDDLECEIPYCVARIDTCKMTLCEIVLSEFTVDDMPRHSSCSQSYCRAAKTHRMPGRGASGLALAPEPPCATGVGPESHRF